MSSKSSSATTNNQYNTSTTQDNRIVGEAGSINFAGSDGNTINSTDNSTTVYNALDAGAVGKSFEFAENVSAGAASLAAASVGAMEDVTRSALGAVQDAYGDSLEGVAGAWKQAGSAMASNQQMTISAITSANEKVTGALSDAWASSKAGEQKMLAFGVMAIVALAASKVLR
ncbi:MAG TPA: hypothetical protein DDX04_12130 [Massilia sp.]|nr:hypothetical protein [Massilia sp.]